MLSANYYMFRPITEFSNNVLRLLTSRFFANLRKATISFVMSVRSAARPSVRR